ncbi:MAG: hypothetical protein Harvfovirus71_3 [Harvfovirus sp.]|uniref:Uncharacterized protein n=1 Tax=Harvfovirus sp. TaxID=2487768 RepID=A0A3G5A3R3_9VIRU|nr:MAG: hypothetical protein Harvfovirus71_3 [Harvfovirus sp.]
MAALPTSEPIVDQEIKILKNYENIIKKLRADYETDYKKISVGLNRMSIDSSDLEHQIQTSNTSSPGEKKTQIDTFREAKKLRNNRAKEILIQLYDLDKRLDSLPKEVPHILDDIEMINNDAIKSIAKIPKDVLSAETVADRMKLIEDERIRRLEKYNINDLITRIGPIIPIYVEEQGTLSKKIQEFLGSLAGGRKDNDANYYYVKYMKYKMKYMNRINKNK